LPKQSRKQKRASSRSLAIGEPVVALVPIEEYRRLCHLASPLRDRVKAWAKTQKKLTRVREWE